MLFAIKCCRGNMTYKLYKAWILIGRYEEVEERLYEAWKDKRLNGCQYEVLARLCGEARRNEDHTRNTKDFGKVGA